VVRIGFERVAEEAILSYFRFFPVHKGKGVLRGFIQRRLRQRGEGRGIARCELGTEVKMRLV